MHQRAAIMKTLSRGTRARFSSLARDESQAFSPARDKALAFFEMLAEQRDICWSDQLVAEFRRDYYDAFDEIMSVLFATDDALIIFQCVQHADFNQPKELEAFKNFIANCNAEKHQVSLRALAETRVPELLAALKKRKQLPESVREVLGGSKKSDERSR